MNTNRQISKGRITNLRDGKFLEFLFNPETVEDSKGANIIVNTLPGQAHPLVRWVSAKERRLSFLLRFDGESSLRFRGVNLLNGAAANELVVQQATETFSVAGELEFFDQFVYPVDPEDDPAGGSDYVVFTMGRRYPGVVCQVESANTKITRWTSSLEPTVAEVNLSLITVVNAQVYSNNVFREYQ